MVAGVSDSALPSGKHCLFESEVDSIKCPNCLVLKEQLQFVPQELELAKTIISLLKDSEKYSLFFFSLCIYFQFLLLVSL